jgi:uncharacterized protein (TIGR03435 family)
MRKSLFVLALLAPVAAVVTVSGTPAQQTGIAGGGSTAAPDPSVPVFFEAASVKLNTEGGQDQYVRRQPGGRFNSVGMPARVLITFAYQLQNFQLVGAPSWLSDERYDIVAKLEGDPPAVMPGSGPDHMMLALRSLLADRFKLKVHRETREMDIYALVMARPGGQPGPALKPSAQDCSPQARRGAPPPTGAGGAPIFCGMQMGPGVIRLGGFPLSQFVGGLGGRVGRMVVDRTGLSGNWNFEMTFAPEGRGGPPPPGVDVPAGDQNAPSLFTAVQEQLGLKLEPTKGPVEVLVVDSVERPTID